jgi:hypothetical protein
LNALAPIVERPKFVPTPKQEEANLLFDGPQLHTLLRGGSRSGKTFITCRRIALRALAASSSRHAIWRFHYNHAKNSIGLDTWPKMMRLCFPDVVDAMGGVRFSHEGVLTMPNGSEIWLGGLDDKERVEKILGMEFATNFFNEASQIPWSSIEIAHSRLAQKVEVDLPKHPLRGHLLPLRNYYDMNPPGKRHWSYSLFRKHVTPTDKMPVPDPDDYREMRINPFDNEANLPEEYFKVLSGMSKAKRLRFEQGEWASDAEGTLWNDEMLDTARVGYIPKGVRLVRTVVGVDPSGSKGANAPKGKAIDPAEVRSNDIGIIVMALGSDGNGYVLEDATINASPGEWGARVVKAAKDHNADRVVAEGNYGGAMVQFVLKSAQRTLPVKMVTSSRGKALRAEPVAALYEDNQLRIKHVGHFPELEEQMVSMMPQPHGYQGEGSPDRLDAMVFAATELMLGSNYHLGSL